MFQHCILIDMTSRRDATSNQRWNNVAYFNVGIYNVKQRRINVVYFNVDVSNVRQHRNNVALFNFEFHNDGQHGKLSTLNSKLLLLFHNLLHFTLNFKKNMLKNTCKAAKIMIIKNTTLQELDLRRFTL